MPILTARWHSLRSLAAQLVMPHATFLVAETGACVVGHAFADLLDARVLHLRRLYVLPAWQRRGIGKRLLAAILDRNPSARQMRLTVEADNIHAVAFYRQQGFLDLADAIKEGVRVIRMHRALNG